MPLMPLFKYHQIFDLLLGARNPRVYPLIEARGFDQSVIDEGWALLTKACGAELEITKPGAPLPKEQKTTELVSALDAWENDWYNVIGATLQRHHPAIYSKVFEGLSRGSGKLAVVSVGLLLDRIEAIRNTEEGVEALALLATRGFDESVISEANSLISSIEQGQEEQVTTYSEESIAVQERAREEVWAWYREWSTIIRAAIKRKDLLVVLGLYKRKRRKAGDDE